MTVESDDGRGTRMCIPQNQVDGMELQGTRDVEEERRLQRKGRTGV